MFVWLTHSRAVTLAALAVAAALALALGAAIAVKGLDQTLSALPHRPVACPEGLPAFVVIGQSQASNTGQGRRFPKKVSYAFADNKCFKLRDPVPGTSGRSGSIWPSFVDELSTPVVIANLSISGSAIKEWTTPDALERVRSTVAQLRKAGYANPTIIWMQGEADGAAKTDAATYLRELNRLLAVAPQAPWLLTRESVCYEEQEKWQPLDEARDRFRAMHANVLIGPDLDTLIPVSLRQRDRCHLTVAGQDKLAAALAVAVRRLNETALIDAVVSPFHIDSRLAAAHSEVRQ